MANSRVCYLTALLLIEVLAVNGQTLVLTLTHRSGNIVALRCNIQYDVDAVDNPVYYIEKNNGSTQRLPYDLQEDRTVMFMITPQLEGKYFCKNGEDSVAESMRLELVGEFTALLPEPCMH